MVVDATSIPPGYAALVHCKLKMETLLTTFEVTEPLSVPVSITTPLRAGFCCSTVQLSAAGDDQVTCVVPPGRTASGLIEMVPVGGADAAQPTPSVQVSPSEQVPELCGSHHSFTMS